MPGRREWENGIRRKKERRKGNRAKITEIDREENGDVKERKRIK